MKTFLKFICMITVIFLVTSCERAIFEPSIKTNFEKLDPVNYYNYKKEKYDNKSRKSETDAEEKKELSKDDTDDQFYIINIFGFLPHPVEGSS